MLGSCLRFVTLWAWLIRWATFGPLLQSSHRRLTLAIQDTLRFSAKLPTQQPGSY